MNFCSNCGSRLINKQSVLLCPKCKQTDSSHEHISIGNRIRKRASRLNLVILDKKDRNLKALPTVNTQCPKCSGKTAETWTVAFGSEDNFQATYFRCVSCGHTTRQLD
jgi:DNA-directed RNA polymerase subunit M/transcription elongation factor TFIIS